MHNGIARTSPICTRNKVRVGASMGRLNYSKELLAASFGKRRMCGKFDA